MTAVLTGSTNKSFEALRCWGRCKPFLLPIVVFNADHHGMVMINLLPHLYPLKCSCDWICLGNTFILWMRTLNLGNHLIQSHTGNGWHSHRQHTYIYTSQRSLHVISTLHFISHIASGSKHVFSFVCLCFVNWVQMLAQEFTNWRHSSFLFKLSNPLFPYL